MSRRISQVFDIVDFRAIFLRPVAISERGVEAFASRADLGAGSPVALLRPSFYSQPRRYWIGRPHPGRPYCRATPPCTLAQFARNGANSSYSTRSVGRFDRLATCRGMTALDAFETWGDVSYRRRTPDIADRDRERRTWEGERLQTCAAWGEEFCPKGHSASESSAPWETRLTTASAPQAEIQTFCCSSNGESRQHVFRSAVPPLMAGMNLGMSERNDTMAAHRSVVAVRNSNFAENKSNRGRHASMRRERN